MSWVVLLNTGAEPVAYGPIADERVAKEFALFLQAEVDPAGVFRLHSVEGELLAFWRNTKTAAIYDRGAVND